MPKHGVFLVLLVFLLFFLSEQTTNTQKPTDGCSLGNAKASSKLLLPLPPSPPQPTFLPFYSPVATEAAKVAMLKVVPRPALNNSQRIAFPKTSPGACTAPSCISPGYDQPTLIILCPLEQKGQFPSLTARPYFKHLWGFTSLLGQVRYLGEVLSLLINPCLLL